MSKPRSDPCSRHGQSGLFPSPPDRADISSRHGVLSHRSTAIQMAIKCGRNRRRTLSGMRDTTWCCITYAGSRALLSFVPNGAAGLDSMWRRWVMNWSKCAKWMLWPARDRDHLDARIFATESLGGFLRYQRRFRAGADDQCGRLHLAHVVPGLVSVMAPRPCRTPATSARNPQVPSGRDAVVHVNPRLAPPPPASLDWPCVRSAPPQPWTQTWCAAP